MAQGLAELRPPGADRLVIFTAACSIATATRTLVQVESDTKSYLDLEMYLADPGDIERWYWSMVARDLTARFGSRFNSAFIADSLLPSASALIAWYSGFRLLTGWRLGGSFTQSVVAKDVPDGFGPAQFVSLSPPELVQLEESLRLGSRVESHITEHPHLIESAPVMQNSPAAKGRSVVLPLTQAKGPGAGTVHNPGAGLNWGIRRNGLSRNPDESYIPVPRPVALSAFFPPRGVHFVALDERGEALHLTTAQSGGKAIVSPYDNAELGRYLRGRLGIGRGLIATDRDLEAAQMNSVEFTLVGAELYAIRMVKA